MGKRLKDLSHSLNSPFEDGREIRRDKNGLEAILASET